MRYTFSRNERLKSKDILASLFKKGSHFVFPPLHVRYLCEAAKETTIQATFSVPKKRFKRAVDRNLIKRRIREAHRLHKHLLKNVVLENPHKISIIYIYASNEISGYDVVEQGVLTFLKHLIEELNQ